MKILPDLKDVRRVAKEGVYSVLPVSTEIPSDGDSPTDILRRLKNRSAHCFMLESVKQNEERGRYTFLGYEPKLGISCINGMMKVGDSVFRTEDPSACIREVMKAYAGPQVDRLPPFTGGLAGYFSYDFLGYTEPSVRNPAEDPDGFLDVDLMLFDKVIAFDHRRGKIILIVNIRLEDPETEYGKAEAELEEMYRLIRYGEKKKEKAGRITGQAEVLFSMQEYCEMVEKAKHHIREGDVFQIVLSNRIRVPYEGSLLNMYRILCRINPSPYMFYFSGTDVEAAGASPETLVRLEKGVLSTYPLAGTRPRGKNSSEDMALEQELLADEKELAEHNMLVDLARNDLGKISRFGTVKVKDFHKIHRYSHVMHIGSTVQGEIREDCDALDAVAAVLPAGTLSGAPKIRACQLIRELEKDRRGIYGGAVGYIDFTGNMDLCIAIRCAYKKNGKVFIRSGAGIVADSVPEKEYMECMNKAGAVTDALKMAEEAEI